MLRRLIATLLTCVLAASPVVSAAVPDSSHCHGSAGQASTDAHHPAAAITQSSHEHHGHGAVPAAATENTQHASPFNAHEDACGCDCTCATGQGCSLPLALLAGSGVRAFAAGDRQCGAELTLRFGQRPPPPSPPPIR